MIAASVIFSSGGAQVPATPTDSNTPQKSPRTVDELLAASAQSLAAGDLDAADSQASLALQLDPKSAAAYEQRGSVYIQKKLWQRAERDYAAADRISPDVAYKYKLAEIKFLQRSFDDARLRFAKLESDERLGDLATFKVFLCDQLGFHPTAAAKDLAQLDATHPKPSYYYSHAIWDYFHNAAPEGNKLRMAAIQAYGQSTDDLYLSSLSELKMFRPSTASFVAKDGTSFHDAPVYLETTGLRVSSPQGWTTLPLDQLPDDLSVFPEDVRNQIAAARTSASASSQPTQLVSFTTRAGTSYSNVRWSLSKDGLSVLTADGWTTIAFTQLPSDLSTFPPDLQESIRAKLKAAPQTPDRLETISFSTKSGKHFDQVRASLTESGVSTLTADGWIIVPYTSLPDDLSAFPSEWRQEILAKRKAPSDTNPEMKVVSFTTRKGKLYTDVRASLLKNGMHLLTPQGWTAVPFDQLPDDLSPFPSDWQKIITERLAENQRNEARR
jgi:tetratricopeptide (TPR) repeat protein